MFINRFDCRKILILAFALRFIWLLLVFSNDGILRTEDSGVYENLAINLFENGEFAQEGKSELYRTPGYPAFVGLNYFLGLGFFAVLFVQVLLSTASVYFLYSLALKISGNKKTALLAGLIYAFEPLSIIYCSYLLSETVFVFCLLAFMNAFYGFIQKQDLKLLSLAAVMLTASMFVRPISYHIPQFFLGIFLIVALKPVWFKSLVSKEVAEKKWELKKLVSSFVLFALITLGSAELWSARNESVGGGRSFYVLNTLFLDIQSMGVISKTEGLSVKDSWVELHRRYEKDPHAGANILKAHPVIFAGIYAKGWVKALFDPGSVDAAKQLGQYPLSGGLVSKMIEEGVFSVVASLFSERPLLMLMSLILLAYLLGLYYLGFRGLRRDCRLLFPLLMVFIYFFLLSGGGYALARYRFPLMSFLVLFAAFGFEKKKELNENS
jgi:hypothetical protein